MKNPRFRLFWLSLVALAFLFPQSFVSPVRQDQTGHPSALAAKLSAKKSAETLFEKCGTAFEEVMVTALDFWGLLYPEWSTQYSVTVDLAPCESFVTRPDLARGTNPASMLSTGTITVADFKLTRTPTLAYPDAQAPDLEHKYRYHWAALAIEEHNRKATLEAFDVFTAWLNGSMPVPASSPELDQWFKIWSIIKQRVNAAQEPSANIEDKYFAKCFTTFYTRFAKLLRDKAALGSEAEQLRALLTEALQNYEVRKEVQILHPAAFADAKEIASQLKKDYPPAQQAQLAQVSVSYLNVFEHWGPLLKRKSSAPIRSELGFILGLYLGAWDFDGNRGAEANAERIRWSENEYGPAAFPLFTFDIESRLQQMQTWMHRDSGEAIPLGAISRGLRVTTQNKAPLKQVVANGLNAKLTYITGRNIARAAKTAAQEILDQIQRVQKSGAGLHDADFIEIMAAIVQKYDLHQLATEQLQSLLLDLLARELYPKLGRPQEIAYRDFRAWLEQMFQTACARVQSEQRAQSAYYGTTTNRSDDWKILNETISKLQASLSRADIDALNGKTADLPEADMNLSALQAVALNLADFFGLGWQSATIKRGMELLIGGQTLSFATLADAKLFLVWVNELRALLQAKKVEELRSIRLKSVETAGRPSSGKTAYRTVQRIAIADNGRVVITHIDENAAAYETGYVSLGAAVRGQQHIDDNSELNLVVLGLNLPPEKIRILRAILKDQKEGEGLSCAQMNELLWMIKNRKVSEEMLRSVHDPRIYQLLLENQNRVPSPEKLSNIHEQHIYQLIANIIEPLLAPLPDERPLAEALGTLEAKQRQLLLYALDDLLNNIQQRSTELKRIMRYSGERQRLLELETQKRFAMIETICIRLEQANAQQTAALISRNVLEHIVKDLEAMPDTKALAQLLASTPSLEAAYLYYLLDEYIARSELNQTNVAGFAVYDELVLGIHHAAQDYHASRLREAA